MKRTLSFIVSALTLFTFLIGCDQTTSSNNSGDTVRNLWKLDSITFNDSTISRFSLEYARFIKLASDSITHYEYTAEIDSFTLFCVVTDDSIAYYFGDELLNTFGFFKNENNIKMYFDYDDNGEITTYFYSPYANKFPPDEWFIVPENDPKLINTSWICDSMTSSGITVKMNNMLYAFTENILTIRQVYDNIVSSDPQRYFTENEELFINGESSGNYQIDGDQLEIGPMKYETTYYFTSYAGDTIPDSWRDLERSKAQIKNKSPFIPAVLKNIKH